MGSVIVCGFYTEDYRGWASSAGSEPGLARPDA